MSTQEPRQVYPPFPDYYIGLDLGRVADYTALAVLERTPVPGHVHRYDVLALLRAPLGTSYPAIVTSVKALVASVELRPYRVYPPNWEGHKVEQSPDPTLVIDATGVGSAVVDLFLQSNVAAWCRPLTITGGSGSPRADRWPSTRHTCYYVPKTELVGVVQALLSTHRISVVPTLPLADVLKAEMRNFEVKLTPAAHETFNAREGQHDDILLAVAIAAWCAEWHDPSAARPLMGFDIPQLRKYRG